MQYLKGVGPVRAAQFAKLGVETAGQLLFLVPRRYIDRSQTKPIFDLSAGDEATVVGRVVSVSDRFLRNSRQVVSCLVRDRTGVIEAVWFNRPDLRGRFKPQQEILLSGEVSRYGHRQFVNPLFELAEGGGFSFANAIIPVYPLTERLSVWTIRRVMRGAIDRFVGMVTESLPREILEHYRYPDVKAALEKIHFPKDMREAEQALERLVYEELLYFELVLALRRHQHRTERPGVKMTKTGKYISPFRRALPFKLTAGQEKVLSEILADMASERSMNRLLQGDVGSGKTVVALCAMLVACENRMQAAMMAPTEILAVQHFRGWTGPLTEVGIEARLLTGSTRAAERRSIIAGLLSGKVQVVFGTHALIEDKVEFSRLGLVVVDEQHRFGVMQRAALLNKGVNPDFLVMTATPIPRTLTLTVYGDLDVSILAEKPAGRRPVVTRVVPEERRPRVYQFIKQRAAAGEQTFFVCPLIDESEKLDLASAEKTFEQVKEAFPGLRVGMVHGRMKSEERQKQMERLRRKELDILVATTVIEVGVDIPDASVMVIEHPERFGLAQLHQLRGRIGRSGKRAYCVLMVQPEVESFVHRLHFFARTGDGFVLAEKDAELRGPGEVLGTRQHGLPDLRIADPFRDRQALLRARRDAFRMIEIDPRLEAPGHRLIRETLASRYKGREELLRVG